MIDRDELSEVIEETLEGILETIGDVASVAPFAPGDEVQWVEAIVPILGPTTDARFVLVIDTATAATMAEVWAGIPADELGPDDGPAVVGELANLFAGSAKTLIDDETRLDVPTAAVVDGIGLDPDSLVVISHQLGEFRVAVIATSGAVSS